MNAPIKFSTQKGEGGTVGYSVMTLLLLYRLLGKSTQLVFTTVLFSKCVPFDFAGGIDQGFDRRL